MIGCLYSFRIFILINVKRVKVTIQYPVESSIITVNHTGIISDESIRLTGYKSRQHYPESFRMVPYEYLATSVI